MGVYRDIRLVSTASAVISYIVPQIFLTNKHWKVEVATYLQCKQGAKGNVTATLETGQTDTVEMECYRTGEQRVDLVLMVREELVKRWFPIGYGEHPMYNLTVRFDGEEQNEKTVEVGFRTAELVREKIGEEEESMFFRVNGIDIFARGTNMIPMDVFESRITTDDIDKLMETAVKGNQNIIRVWGGGLYQRDYFYQVADRLGLMVVLALRLDA